MPDIPKPTCDHCPCRDRAVDLLRQVQRWLKRGGTSSVAGRIDSFLADQTCQRCGGEGLVAKPDAPGIRTRWYEDCPDCKLSDDQ